MNDDVKSPEQGMRSALRGLLPPELVAEAIRDVFPVEVMRAAFLEGLALFFSPFTGFWRMLRDVTRRNGRRQDGEQQWLGAE